MAIFDLSPQDRDALVRFAQDLIRIPSPSTKEGKVAARLTEEMRRVGFRDVLADRIGNVVGRIGSGEGKGLFISGHMDTVGVGDRSTWKRDPYGADVEQGILYGRGACDMKGALAAMVYGAKLLLDAGVELAGDLYVVGTVQEEPCEGLGIRVLVEEGPRPDFVVLGEATDMQLSRGQRGRMEIKVTTQGRSCHASTPARGENAVYAAARLIFGIEILASQLVGHSFLGPGSIAVTQIESSAASRNAVPDVCTLYIDRRLTLGETETQALAEIQRIIAREGIKAQMEVTEYRAISYTGYECRAKEYFPPWVLDEAHPLVRVASRAIRKELGYRPRIGCWAFSTDGVYTMGQAGIPTIGFGPGEERFAHT
ncbi:MAG: YgeY family selenium metabolism-linked hydrolase, partial [Chloroflexota bacterium]|nr:YgeY family selenium metabolism-linked hydrolase [Chloroflexota bacterium]